MASIQRAKHDSEIIPDFQSSKNGHKNTIKLVGRYCRAKYINPSICQLRT